MAAMTVEQAKEVVLSKVGNSVQRRGMINTYFNEITVAFAGLATLGQTMMLDIADAVPKEVEKYPMMLYKRREPEPKIVNSADEEKALRKAGWNEWPGGEKPVPGPEPEYEPPPSVPPVVTVALKSVSGAMPLPTEL